MDRHPRTYMDGFSKTVIRTLQSQAGSFSQNNKPAITGTLQICWHNNQMTSFTGSKAPLCFNWTGTVICIIRPEPLTTHRNSHSVHNSLVHHDCAPKATFQLYKRPISNEKCICSLLLPWHNWLKIVIFICIFFSKLKCELLWFHY